MYKPSELFDSLLVSVKVCCLKVKTRIVEFKMKGNALQLLDGSQRIIRCQLQQYFERFSFSKCISLKHLVLFLWLFCLATFLQQLKENNILLGISKIFVYKIRPILRKRKLLFVAAFTLQINLRK